MDLVRLLGKEFESSVVIDCPKNLCAYVVSHVQNEYFSHGHQLNALFVRELLTQTIAKLRVLSNVVRITRSKSETGGYTGRVSVTGDLHGQYRDLAFLLSSDGPIGFPSLDNQIIVNGDMIGQGGMSVEIVVLLSLFTVMSPASVHVLKGNHEVTPSLRTCYGFDEELRLKYDSNDKIKELFVHLFDALPVAAEVDSAVFVTHGGVGAFTHTMTPAQINRGNRFVTPIPNTPLYELLWNYPETPVTSKVKNPVQPGEAFDSTYTTVFLVKNKHTLLLCALQYSDSGFRVDHHGSCYSVLSAPNYLSVHGNTGAVVIFDDMYHTKPRVEYFECVHNPEKSIMCAFGKRMLALSTQNQDAGQYDEQLDYELQMALALSTSTL